MRPSDLINNLFSSELLIFVSKVLYQIECAYAHAYSALKMRLLAMVTPVSLAHYVAAFSVWRETTSDFDSCPDKAKQTFVFDNRQASFEKERLCVAQLSMHFL